MDGMLKGRGPTPLWFGVELAVASDATLVSVQSISDDALAYRLNRLRGTSLFDLVKGQATDHHALRAVLSKDAEGAGPAMLDMTLVEPKGHLLPLLAFFCGRLPFKDGQIRGYASFRHGDAFSVGAAKEGARVLAMLEHQATSEQELRKDEETLLACLRILLEPAPLPQACQALIQAFERRLGVGMAVVLRRKTRNLWTVAATTHPSLNGLDCWDNRGFAELGERARELELDSATVSCLPQQIRRLLDRRWIIAAPIKVSGELAVLMIAGREGEPMPPRGFILVERLTLLAGQAFEAEVNRTAVFNLSKFAALGELIGSIAHEVNQPLSAIAMSAQNLVSMLEDGTDAKQAVARAHKIHRNAMRVGDIIQSLRRLSYPVRDDQGNAAIGLRQLMADIQSIIGDGLTRRGLILDIDMPVKGLWARGHPVALQQVLVNLINNARDAILERGRTDSGAPRGRISICAREEASGFIRIEVFDNGGGIPEDVIERVFDHFFTMKDVQEGTGLGLTVSRRLVEDMNGTLEARNETGGAVLTIRLPKASPERAIP